MLSGTEGSPEFMQGSLRARMSARVRARFLPRLLQNLSWHAPAAVAHHAVELVAVNVTHSGAPVWLRAVMTVTQTQEPRSALACGARKQEINTNEAPPQTDE